MSYLVTMHHADLNVYLKTFASEDEARTMAQHLAEAAGVIKCVDDMWTCERFYTVKLVPSPV